MKKITFALSAIVFLLSTSGALAYTATSGGVPKGVACQNTFNIHNDNVGFDATDIHFRIWQKESNIKVNGWSIGISEFTSSNSERAEDNPEHAVDINAAGGMVPYCVSVQIDATLFLTNHNTVRIKDVIWTAGMPSLKACPDFGWKIGFPKKREDGRYDHKIIFFNDDSAPITISDISFVKDYMYYDFFTLDSLGSGLFDFPDTTFVGGSINAGDSLVYNMVTDSSFIGGHLYGFYNVNDGQVLAMLGHPVTREILPSLTGWGMIILIVLLLVSTLYILYRRRQTV